MVKDGVSKHLLSVLRLHSWQQQLPLILEYLYVYLQPLLEYVTPGHCGPNHIRVQHD